MNHFISFLVILFATSFTTTSTLNCPDPELILPCQCSNFPSKKVSCKDISSLRLVRNLLEEHIGDQPIEALTITGVNSFFLPPRVLGNLSPIRLTLSDSNIRHLDDHVFQNQRLLSMLILYNCRLQEIPKGALKHITRLETLALTKNFLMRIPYGSLNTLTNLTFLGLTDNRLSSIDKDAFPKNLRILSISRNLLDTFNGSLNSLSKLIGLSAADNRLTNVDGEFDGLISLETLHLDRNYLSDIPKSLAKLETLKELSLSGNRIQVVGKTLNSLPKLEFLNLAHNYITEINRNAFEKMKDLSVLNLSGNYLKVICPSLKPLRFMNELILSDLNLKILEPDCFHNMKILRKLDISYNRLPDVGAVFRHPLPDLFHLRLDHNRLNEFNYDMKYLRNLRILELGFNNISSLKEDIFANNRNLKIFKMEGNPWECSDEMLLMLRDLEQRNVDMEGQPDC